MDVEEVADELYGLPLEEFTPIRNERAKQARAGGDRELAVRITALRKPTMAAWLTNQLVRSHAVEVQLLLDLGRELRDVLADVEGEELRELTRQRYQLVSALVLQARALANARGRRVSDEVTAGVRTTLEATLADEASADVVAAGRLTDTLEVSGFGVASPEGRAAAAAPTAQRARTAPAPVTDLESERRRREHEQAQRQLAAAQTREVRARQSAEEAAERLRGVREDLGAASAVASRLRAELDRATAEVATLQTQEQAASAEEQTARQELEVASDEVAAARARAAALSDA